MSTKRPNVKRIQFELSDEALERLERMKKLTQRSTFTDVVRDALRTHEWFTRQTGAGYGIGLMKDEKLVKIVEFVH